jgi:hypothetical protein
LPVSRSRLPAAPLDGPRPVDTHVKTGDQPAEKAPRRVHWAWLVVAFLVFLGIGFGGVLALIDSTRDDTPPVSAEASEPEVADDQAEDVAVAAAPDASQPAAEEIAPAVAAAVDAAPAPEAERVAAAPELVDRTSPEDAADPAPDKGPPAANEKSAGSVARAGADEDDGEREDAERMSGEDIAPADADRALAAKIEPQKIKTAPGQLFVQVDPWGNVAIDGRPKGRAPFEGELRAGVHTVTVTNSFFKGSYSFRIKVEPGKRTARTVVLEDHLDKVE